jgi:hypothetical protein
MARPTSLCFYSYSTISRQRAQREADEIARARAEETARQVGQTNKCDGISLTKKLCAGTGAGS